MRAIGIDPGTNNMGVSGILFRKTGIKVKFSFMLQETISNLLDHPVKRKEKTTFEEQRRIFTRKFSRMLREFKPSILVIERFQSRGLKGATIEKISIMIGIVAYLCDRYKIKMVLPVAATWKNWVKRTLHPKWLDDCYLEGKKLKVKPHMIDSVIMIMWARKWDMKPLKSKKQRAELLRMIAASTSLDAVLAASCSKARAK